MLRSRFVLIALVLFFISLFARADSSQDARFLIHLMDYLAKDYAGAVQNGKIISKDEYAEQVEFAEKSLNFAKNLNSPELEKQTIELKKQILNKENAEKISLLARKIQAQTLDFSKLAQVPLKWPKISEGKKLYANTCVACHGLTGAGNGPAGASLSPAPTNFRDESTMSNLTPFQAFNAIRLGIPGTGMAPNPQLTDDQIWELAFYIISIRHGDQPNNEKIKAEFLSFAATHNDRELAAAGEIPKKIRLHEEKDASTSAFLSFASASIQNAMEDYRKGNRESATNRALQAYLEGIEPIEPRLKAKDPVFMAELESTLAEFRTLVGRESDTTKVQTSFEKANLALTKTATLLEAEKPSAWLTFSLASGILFREGFEAVLILIALLSVIRAAKSKKAEQWLHGGWISAVGLGVITWFFSSWLSAISGAQREMMEAFTSLVAVAVLLYIGFWMHSHTEINRWKYFIDEKVKKAIDGGNVIGIFGIAFIAVFREAFETVLFLQAIAMESQTSSTAMLLGVCFAFTVVFLLAWAFLKYSVKAPIRKIFTISSLMLIGLAVILTGKGLHSLQETGALSITPSVMNVRIELIGFFPTLETTIAQIAMLGICIWLWQLGKRSPAHTT